MSFWIEIDSEQIVPGLMYILAHSFTACLENIVQCTFFFFFFFFFGNVCQELGADEVLVVLDIG